MTQVSSLIQGIEQSHKWVEGGLRQFYDSAWNAEQRAGIIPHLQDLNDMPQSPRRDDAFVCLIEQYLKHTLNVGSIQALIYLYAPSLIDLYIEVFGPVARMVSSHPQDHSARRRHERN